jgi:phosphatidylglycerol lysyltransferase
VLALLVMRRELRTLSWHELVQDALDLPWGQLALSIALTALNYVVLAGYDFLAFAYIGRRLAPARIALTSFLAYAIANSVGFAMLSGASVRYRFYTRWGVTAEELSRLVFSNTVTFWLGLLFLGGLSLATSNWPYAVPFPGYQAARGIGWALGLSSVGFVALTAVRPSTIRIGSYELPLPAPRIAAAQLAISVLDWALAAGVLYALLPEIGVSFFQFVGMFTVAQLLALASHVPGGVGVFEGLMVVLLSPFPGSAGVLPALVVYRVVYYLAPLTIALLLLVADEARQRRAQAARVGTLLGRVADQFTPRVLAVFTFLSGVLLLFSGATPAAAGRLALLHQIFPVEIVEASHFLGSVVGAGLLVLSQGLARRLDAAYLLTSGAIVAGIAVSLLKGADYEEAIVLALVLVALWRARHVFDRRAAFFETRFSAGWLVAVAGAMAASIWLGLFAFRHVEFSTELWWQFELHAEVSRFLRGSVGAAMFLLVVALARLVRPAAHEIDEPTEEDLAAATSIIDAQTRTSPYLVLLGDKAIQFDEERRGFVMYGVQGRTWVALGDPVAPPDRIAGLIRAFLERSDDFDGAPVFYEVGKHYLFHYADFGMTFVKLGEEAVVDLASFTTEGGRARRHRQALHQLERAGATFRVAPPTETAAIMPALRDVSDDWLREKVVAEKGFSLGFFSPRYLARFPLAVIERGGEVLAFASLWPGPSRVELSVDLMRYRHDAPEQAMEGLLVHLLRWAQREGYQTFSLGMAPLSGFERSPIAPLWSQLGSFVYEHGEAFYGFQGLRAYKEKFHPRWEPRYLVYPGGFRLPRILADIAALIAGGYRRILLK